MKEKYMNTKTTSCTTENESDYKEASEWSFFYRKDHKEENLK